MEKFCVVCNNPDPNPKYKPPENSDFICSSCVQVLLNSLKEEMQEAIRRCEKTGNLRKAAGIKIFVGLKPYAKKDNDQKRIHRGSGPEVTKLGGNPINPAQEPAKVSLCSGQPKGSIVY